MRKNKKNQIIAFVILIAFTTTSFQMPQSWAAPVPLEAVVSDVKSKFLLDISLMDIPKDIGEVEESFQGKTHQTVLILQDAHAIPEAQRNLQKLIQYFQNRYGVFLTGLEGASEEFDTQIFRTFPDPKRLRQLFEVFFDKGEMTGGTAAAVFGNEQARYVGVEEWRLYEQALELYLRASEAQAKNTTALDDWEKDLNQRERKVFSPELLKVTRALREFEQNHADLSAVLKILADIKAPEAGSQIETMLKFIQQEGRDQGADEARVREIADKIKKEIGAEGSIEETAKFNREYQAFQTGQLSVQAFALFLQTVPGTKGTGNPNTPLSTLPVPFVPGTLQRIAGDQKKIRDIEGTKFFDEFEAYAAQVKGELYRSDTDRALDQEGSLLALFTKLNQLELSHQEWQSIRSWVVDNPAKGEGPESIPKEIASRGNNPEGKDKTGIVLSAAKTSVSVATASQNWADSSVETGLGLQRSVVTQSRSLQTLNLELPALFKTHFEFYENAQKRDGALLKNLLRWMNSDKPHSAAMLVAGGFHSQGLTRRLRKQGISYALIRPQLRGVPEQTAYAAQMAGRVSWSSYFKVEKGRVSVYKAFVRYARDQLLGQSRESSVVGLEGGEVNHSRSTPPNPLLLKTWRDEILRSLAKKNQLERAGEYTFFFDELTETEKNKKGDAYFTKADYFFEELQTLVSGGRLSTQSFYDLLKSVQSFGGLNPLPAASVVPGAVSTTLAAKFKMRAPLLGLGKSVQSPAFIESRSEVRERNVLVKTLVDMGSDSVLTIKFPPLWQSDNETVDSFLTRRFAAEFLSDTEVLEKIYGAMGLNGGGGAWHYSVSFDGGTRDTGSSRAVFKMHIIASKGDEKYEKYFALKLINVFAPAYDGNQAGVEQLAASERDQSAMFQGNDLFAESYSENYIARSIGLDTDTRAILHGKFERIRGILNRNKSLAATFQLASWVEGIRADRLMAEIEKLPEDSKVPLKDALMAKILKALVLGWDRLKIEGKGLIYDSGLDDVILKGSTESITALVNQGTVVFIDADGGHRNGSEWELFLEIEVAVEDARYHAVKINPKELARIIVESVGSDRAQDLFLYVADHYDRFKNFNKAIKNLRKQVRHGDNLQAPDLDEQEMKRSEVRMTEEAREETPERRKEPAETGSGNMAENPLSFVVGAEHIADAPIYMPAGRWSLRWLLRWARLAFEFSLYGGIITAFAWSNARYLLPFNQGLIEQSNFYFFPAALLVGAITTYLSGVISRRIDTYVLKVMQPKGNGHWVTSFIKYFRYHFSPDKKYFRRVTLLAVYFVPVLGYFIFGWLVRQIVPDSVPYYSLSRGLLSQIVLSPFAIDIMNQMAMRMGMEGQSFRKALKQTRLNLSSFSKWAIIVWLPVMMIGMKYNPIDMVALFNIVGLSWGSVSLLIMDRLPSGEYQITRPKKSGVLATLSAGMDRFHRGSFLGPYALMVGMLAYAGTLALLLADLAPLSALLWTAYGVSLAAVTIVSPRLYRWLLRWRSSGEEPLQDFFDPNGFTVEGSAEWNVTAQDLRRIARHRAEFFNAFNDNETIKRLQANHDTAGQMTFLIEQEELWQERGEKLDDVESTWLFNRYRELSAYEKALKFYENSINETFKNSDAVRAYYAGLLNKLGREEIMDIHRPDHFHPKILEKALETAKGFIRQRIDEGMDLDLGRGSIRNLLWELGKPNGSAQKLRDLVEGFNGYFRGSKLFDEPGLRRGDGALDVAALRERIREQPEFLVNTKVFIQKKIAESIYPDLYTELATARRHRYLLAYDLLRELDKPAETRTASDRKKLKKLLRLYGSYFKTKYLKPFRNDKGLLRVNAMLTALDGDPNFRDDFKVKVEASARAFLRDAQRVYQDIYSYNVLNYHAGMHAVRSLIFLGRDGEIKQARQLAPLVRLAALQGSQKSFWRNAALLEMALVNPRESEVSESLVGLLQLLKKNSDAFSLLEHLRRWKEHSAKRGESTALLESILRIIERVSQRSPQQSVLDSLEDHTGPPLGGREDSILASVKKRFAAREKREAVSLTDKIEDHLIRLEKFRTAAMLPNNTKYGGLIMDLLATQADQNLLEGILEYSPPLGLAFKDIEDPFELNTRIDEFIDELFRLKDSHVKQKRFESAGSLDNDKVGAQMKEFLSFLGNEISEEGQKLSPEEVQKILSSIGATNALAAAILGIGDARYINFFKQILLASHQTYRLRQEMHKAYDLLMASSDDAAEYQTALSNLQKPAAILGSGRARREFAVMEVMIHAPIELDKTAATPGIQWQNGPAGRRPILSATSIDVQEHPYPVEIERDEQGNITALTLHDAWYRDLIPLNQYRIEGQALQAFFQTGSFTLTGAIQTYNKQGELVPVDVVLTPTAYAKDRRKWPRRYAADESGFYVGGHRVKKPGVGIFFSQKWRGEFQDSLSRLLSKRMARRTAESIGIGHASRSEVRAVGEVLEALFLNAVNHLIQAGPIAWVSVLAGVLAAWFLLPRVFARGLEERRLQRLKDLKSLSAKNGLSMSHVSQGKNWRALFAFLKKYEAVYLKALQNEIGWIGLTTNQEDRKTEVELARDVLRSFQPIVENWAAAKSFQFWNFMDRARFKRVLGHFGEVPEFLQDETRVFLKRLDAKPYAPWVRRRTRAALTKLKKSESSTLQSPESRSEMRVVEATEFYDFFKAKNPRGVLVITGADFDAEGNAQQAFIDRLKAAIGQDQTVMIDVSSLVAGNTKVLSMQEPGATVRNDDRMEDVELRLRHIAGAVHNAVRQAKEAAGQKQTDRRPYGLILKELLKNAVYYGNGLDFTLPVAFKLGFVGDELFGIEVFDHASLLDARRFPFSTLALGGEGAFYDREIQKTDYRFVGDAVRAIPVQTVVQEGGLTIHKVEVALSEEFVETEYFQIILDDIKKVQGFYRELAPYMGIGRNDSRHLGEFGAALRNFLGNEFAGILGRSENYTEFVRDLDLLRLGVSEGIETLGVAVQMMAALLSGKPGEAFELPEALTADATAANNNSRRFFVNYPKDFPEEFTILLTKQRPDLEVVLEKLHAMKSLLEDLHLPAARSSVRGIGGQTQRSEVRAVGEVLEALFLNAVNHLIQAGPIAWVSVLVGVLAAWFLLPRVFARGLEDRRLQRLKDLKSLSAKNGLSMSHVSQGKNWRALFSFLKKYEAVYREALQNEIRWRGPTTNQEDRKTEVELAWDVLRSFQPVVENWAAAKSFQFWNFMNRARFKRALGHFGEVPEFLQDETRVFLTRLDAKPYVPWVRRQARAALIKLKRPESSMTQPPQARSEMRTPSLFKTGMLEQTHEPLQVIAQYQPDYLDGQQREILRDVLGRLQNQFPEFETDRIQTALEQLGRDPAAVNTVMPPLLRLTGFRQQPYLDEVRGLADQSRFIQLAHRRGEGTPIDLALVHFYNEGYLHWGDNAAFGRASFEKAVSMSRPDAKGIILRNLSLHEMVDVDIKGVTNSIVNRYFRGIQNAAYFVQAFKEAVKNAVIHGNRNTKNNVVVIRWRTHDRYLIVDVIDQNLEPIDFASKSARRSNSEQYYAGAQRGVQEYVRLFLQEKRMKGSQYDYPLMDQDGSRRGQVLRLITRYEEKNIPTGVTKSAIIIQRSEIRSQRINEAIASILYAALYEAQVQDLPSEATTRLMAEHSNAAKAAVYQLALTHDLEGLKEVREKVEDAMNFLDPQIQGTLYAAYQRWSADIDRLRTKLSEMDRVDDIRNLPQLIPFIVRNAADPVDEAEAQHLLELLQTAIASKEPDRIWSVEDLIALVVSNQFGLEAVRLRHPEYSFSRAAEDPREPRVFIQRYVEKTRAAANSEDRFMALTALQAALSQIRSLDFKREDYSRIPEIELALNLFLELYENEAVQGHEDLQRIVSSGITTVGYKFPWAIPLILQKLASFKRAQLLASETADGQAERFGRLANQLTNQLRNLGAQKFSTSHEGVFGYISAFTLSLMDITTEAELLETPEDYDELDLRATLYLGLAASRDNLARIKRNPADSDRARVMMLLWKEFMEGMKKVREVTDPLAETLDEEAEDELVKKERTAIQELVLTYTKLIEMLLVDGKPQSMKKIIDLIYDDDEEKRARAARWLLWFSKFGNSEAAEFFKKPGSPAQEVQAEWQNQNEDLDQQYQLRSEMRSTGLSAEDDAFFQSVRQNIAGQNLHSREAWFDVYPGLVTRIARWNAEHAKRVADHQTISEGLFAERYKTLADLLISAHSELDEVRVFIAKLRGLQGLFGGLAVVTSQTPETVPPALLTRPLIPPRLMEVIQKQDLNQLLQETLLPAIQKARAAYLRDEKGYPRAEYENFQAYLNYFKYAIRDKLNGLGAASGSALYFGGGSEAAAAFLADRVIIVDLLDFQEHRFLGVMEDPRELEVKLDVFLKTEIPGHIKNKALSGFKDSIHLKIVGALPLLILELVFMGAENISITDRSDFEDAYTISFNLMGRYKEIIFAGKRDARDIEKNKPLIQRIVPGGVDILVLKSGHNLVLLPDQGRTGKNLTNLLSQTEMLNEKAVGVLDYASLPLRWSKPLIRVPLPPGATFKFAYDQADPETSVAHILQGMRLPTAGDKRSEMRTDTNAASQERSPIALSEGDQIVEGLLRDGVVTVQTDYGENFVFKYLAAETSTSFGALEYQPGIRGGPRFQISLFHEGKRIGYFDVKLSKDGKASLADYGLGVSVDPGSGAAEFRDVATAALWTHEDYQRRKMATTIIGVALRVLKQQGVLTFKALSARRGAIPLWAKEAPRHGVYRALNPELGAFEDYINEDYHYWHLAEDALPDLKILPGGRSEMRAQGGDEDGKRISRIFSWEKKGISVHLVSEDRSHSGDQLDEIQKQLLVFLDGLPGNPISQLRSLVTSQEIIEMGEMSLRFEKKKGNIVFRIDDNLRGDFSPSIPVRSEMRSLLSRGEFLRISAMSAAGFLSMSSELLAQKSGTAKVQPEKLAAPLEAYRKSSLVVFSQYLTEGFGALRTPIKRNGIPYNPLVLMDRIGESGLAFEKDAYDYRYTQPLVLGMWAQILALQLEGALPKSRGVKDPMWELEQYYQLLALMQETLHAPVWLKPGPMRDRDQIGFEDLVGYDGNLIAAIDSLARSLASQKNLRVKERLKRLMTDLMKLVTANDAIYEKLYDPETGIFWGDYNTATQMPIRERHADRIKTNEVRPAAALRIAMLVARKKVPESVWTKVPFMTGPAPDGSTVVYTWKGGAFQYAYPNMYALEDQYPDMVQLNQNAARLFIAASQKSRGLSHFPTAVFAGETYVDSGGLKEVSEAKDADPVWSVPGIAPAFGTPEVLTYAQRVHAHLEMANRRLGGLLFESKRNGVVTPGHTAVILLPSLIVLGRMGNNPAGLNAFLGAEALHGIKGLRQILDSFYLDPEKLDRRTLNGERINEIISIQRSEVRSFSSNGLNNGFRGSIDGEPVFVKGLYPDPRIVGNYAAILNVRTPAGNRVAPRVIRTYVPRTRLDVEATLAQQTGLVLAEKPEEFLPEEALRILKLTNPGKAELIFHPVDLRSEDDYTQAADQLGIKDHESFLMTMISGNQMIVATEWIGPNILESLAGRVGDAEYAQTLGRALGETLATLHNHHLIAGDTHLEQFVVNEQDSGALQVLRVDLANTYTTEQADALSGAAGINVDVEYRGIVSQLKRFPAAQTAFEAAYEQFRSELRSASRFTPEEPVAKIRSEVRVEVSDQKLNIPKYSLRRAFFHHSLFFPWEGSRVFQAPLMATDHFILSILEWGFSPVMVGLLRFLEGFTAEAGSRRAFVSHGHRRFSDYSRTISNNTRKYTGFQEAAPQWDQYRLEISKAFEVRTGWKVVPHSDPYLLAYPDQKTKTVWMAAGWFIKEASDNDHLSGYLLKILGEIENSIQAMKKREISRALHNQPRIQRSEMRTRKDDVSSLDVSHLPAARSDAAGLPAWVEPYSVEMPGGGDSHEIWLDREFIAGLERFFSTNFPEEKRITLGGSAALYMILGSRGPLQTHPLKEVVGDLDFDERNVISDYQFSAFTVNSVPTSLLVFTTHRPPISNVYLDFIFDKKQPQGFRIEFAQPSDARYGQKYDMQNITNAVQDIRNRVIQGTGMKGGLTFEWAFRALRVFLFSDIELEAHLKEEMIAKIRLAEMADGLEWMGVFFAQTLVYRKDFFAALSDLGLKEFFLEGLTRHFVLLSKNLFRRDWLEVDEEKDLQELQSAWAVFLAKINDADYRNLWLAILQRLMEENLDLDVLQVPQALREIRSEEGRSNRMVSGDSYFSGGQTGRSEMRVKPSLDPRLMTQDSTYDEARKTLGALSPELAQFLTDRKLATEEELRAWAEQGTFVVLQLGEAEFEQFVRQQMVPGTKGTGNALPVPFVPGTVQVSPQLADFSVKRILKNFAATRSEDTPDPSVTLGFDLAGEEPSLRHVLSQPGVQRLVTRGLLSKKMDRSAFRSVEGINLSVFNPEGFGHRPVNDGSDNRVVFILTGVKQTVGVKKYAAAVQHTSTTAELNRETFFNGVSDLVEILAGAVASGVKEISSTEDLKIEANQEMIKTELLRRLFASDLEAAELKESAQQQLFKFEQDENGISLQVDRALLFRIITEIYAEQAVASAA